MVAYFDLMVSYWSYYCYYCCCWNWLPWLQGIRDELFVHLNLDQQCSLHRSHLDRCRSFHSYHMWLQRHQSQYRNHQLDSYPMGNQMLEDSTHSFHIHLKNISLNFTVFIVPLAVETTSAKSKTIRKFIFFPSRTLALPGPISSGPWVPMPPGLVYHSDSLLGRNSYILPWAATAANTANVPNNFIFGIYLFSFADKQISIWWWINWSTSL